MPGLGLDALCTAILSREDEYMSVGRQYPPSSYYDVLGITESATRAEVRESYLELVGHRRAVGFASDQALLNEAFEVLMDNRERAVYDEYLRGIRRPSKSAARAATGQASRRRGPRRWHR